jgi:hypothetical protein
MDLVVLVMFGMAAGAGTFASLILVPERYPDHTARVMAAITAMILLLAGTAGLAIILLSRASD